MRNYQSALPSSFWDHIALGVIIALTTFCCPALAPAAEPPAPLAAEDRAEAYRQLYRMRDAQANATELRARAQQALMQAADLDKRAQEAFASFEALRLAKGREDCRLDDELAWVCTEPAAPTPAPSR